MQTLIWAFVSMLVLLLTISILPLGFSNKGKVLIVLVSFVLALAGIGAMTTFSIWLTGLMLVVLVFFTAYMMDSKIGAFLYKEKLSFAEDLIDENDIPNQAAQLLKNNYLPDIAKTEVELPSIENLPIKSNSKSIPELFDATQEKEHSMENMDDEISFLIDRNSDTPTIGEYVDSDNEIGYLSEIESLLEDELEEKPKNTESGRLEELAEVSINTLEETLNDQDGGEVDRQLDELSFEVDLAAKEVAVGIDLDEKSPSKLEPTVMRK
jgi:hypothetical protein